jgi:hypothetical protein
MPKTAQPWPNEAVGWACAFVCGSPGVSSFCRAWSMQLLFTHCLSVLEHAERCSEVATASL